MSNAECRRVESLCSVFLILSIEYFTSTFINQYSIFVFQSFFYRSDWPVFGQWI
ncbi:hypothetical protein D1AOALGA4SA_5848 [Olavius algarvensis Delta 1 endosymbiont]|nr:hypothetical protein D1AOALGA4SA_5848 [Olavius algarvensis Delta 1 endosymbiont]